MAIRARRRGFPQKLGPSGVAVVQTINTVTGKGGPPVKVSAVKLSTLGRALDAVTAIKASAIGRRR